jgi:hypothetical protein
MLSRTVKRNALKLLAVALLAGAHSSLANAEEWFCNQEEPCNYEDSCEGTGLAWADCEIWCYVNAGQYLSGYANCAEVIES